MWVLATVQPRATLYMMGPPVSPQPWIPLCLFIRRPLYLYSQEATGETQA